MKYKITFKGKFVDDIDRKDILSNLADLFDESIADVHHRFFSGRSEHVTLITGLDNYDAQEYQQALKDAGLLADIDLDFDIDASMPPDNNFVSKTTQPTRQSNDQSIKLVDIDNAKAVDVEKESIHRQFLQTQDFTLAKAELEAPKEAEEKRIHRLKKIAQENAQIEIDDTDHVAIPPLFHSGVRVGRVRFIYRVTLALGILFACFNILPIYLQKYLGNSGFIMSFILLFFAAMFVLMTVSQRFCDIDNLSLGKIVFVAVVLGTLVFSLFVQNYYDLKELKIAFAEQFLKDNIYTNGIYPVKEAFKAYMVEQSKPHFLQQVDSYIKWIVYTLVVGGGILLMALPGIEGNNQFGSPPSQVNAVSTIVFVFALMFCLYSVTYPFNTRSHTFTHRLYQTQLYEYLGALKPLPPVLNSAYKEYLLKNSTQST